MGYCKVGELGTSFLYMALFVFFLFLEWYSLQGITMENEVVLILIVVFFNLSEILCGLFEVIVRIRTKNREKRNLSISSGTKIQLERNLTQTIQLGLIYLVIVILDSSTTFCFIYSCYYIQAYQKDSALDTLNKGIQIIFSFFASKIILQYNVEKYKILAMILMFIGFAINAVISITSLLHGFDIFLYFIQVLMNCGTAIQEVIEKFLIHKKYQSPFFILFIEGVFGNIFSLIFFFSFMGFTDNIKNWFISNVSNLFIFGFICTGYTCFRIIINRKTSPTHRVVADTFYSFLSYVLYLTQERIIDMKLFFSLFGHVIVIIGSLIYNEYIILQFCGFDKDTKKEIDRRASEEILESGKIIWREYELYERSTIQNLSL